MSKKLRVLKERIVAYEKQYKRIPGSVRLLAASKTQSIEKLHALLPEQTIFGENYLQEAITKILHLPSHLEWHFIGSIQRNKTAKIAEFFSWVQTVCDANIAKRLNEQRLPEFGPLNICLQVNLAQETTKSGVQDIHTLFELAEYCLTLPQLKLRGIMGMPPFASDLETQRRYLQQIAEAYQALQQQFPAAKFDTLSMGMSDDLEAAIAEGATMVRIGRDLFGPRI